MSGPSGMAEEMFGAKFAHEKYERQGMAENLGIYCRYGPFVQMENVVTLEGVP